MSLKFETHGAQIDGARDYQEDAFLITPIISETEGKSALLAVLADGMGGHAAGNVASNLAVEAFTQYITDHYFESENHNLLLKEALVIANEVLARNIRETAALKGMGCTFIGALFTETGMQWISVGDSHLYLFRGGKLLKKNADHSYGGYLDRMAAEGNEVDENSGYSRHMLLSALTGEPIPAVDSPEHPIMLQAGDRVLLSSDGVDTLTQEDLTVLMTPEDSAKALCTSILAKVTAAQMPRQDNTTVVIISWPAEASQGQKISGELDLDPISQDPDSTKPDIKISSATRTAATQKVAAQTTAKSSGKGKFNQTLFAILTIAIFGTAWFFFQQQDKKTEQPEIADTTTEMIQDIEVPIDPVNQISPPESPADIETVEAEQQITGTPSVAAAPEKEHLFTLFNDRLKSGSLAPAMIPLPAGEFTMGGTGVSPPENERPKHKVTVGAFAISQNEITRAEFARFTGKKVKKTDQNLPVNFVSHSDAVAYTKWLSKQTGSIYRLPSEAEWEYAARGGTSSPYWWGYKVEENKATCVGCGIPMEPDSPTLVGSHEANPYGLIDMSGNVAEWTADCYHANYDGAPVDGTAWVEKACDNHVIRGGSYTNAVKSIMSSTRELAAKKTRSASIGLRVVRELP